MKAIVKPKNSDGLTLEERPIPTYSEGEVLIKVKKTSICGTDLHIYKWNQWTEKNIKPPVIIGHEGVGVIAEVGANVREFKVGDRVVAEGHITCGKCAGCLSGKRHLCAHPVGIGIGRDGCFAEYFTAPEENLFKIPDSIDDDLAAIFDPFGNAVHTALSFPLTAEDVLITGAGPIGMMAAAIAKKAGARNVVVTDINEKRLLLAKEMGATLTVNVKEQNIEDVAQELGIEGFSVGMEMSGNPLAFQSMLKTMRPGGKIAILGLLPSGAGIDWDQVIFKMLTIKGIYGREIFSTWQQMIALLESGLNLKPVITHYFDYKDFELGFDAMFSGSGKVILNWDQ
ncbi:MAG: L-threonine 3-dehydrogenase [Waddliaceae bacterium]